MNEGQVEVGGLKFGYLELGEGPLALLLHGFPDTPHGWKDVMPALAERGYRVVAPFTRGYAPTESKGPVTTVDELAEDAIGLIGALGHDRAEVLIGHDWGAATVYTVASARPEKVGRLVAVGIPHLAALKPSLKLLWEGRHFVSLNLPGAAARTRRAQFANIDGYYRRWSPTWDFSPEETAPVKRCFENPESLEAAIGYYRGARRGMVPRGLRGTIDVPTLAVAGADDPVLTLDVYEKARRKFTNAYRVVALPGGHFVHRESPDGFREAVLEFVS